MGPAFHYSSPTCHGNTVPCQGNDVAPSHCVAGLTRVLPVPSSVGVCVGQNGHCKGKPVMDRWLRNSCHESKVTRGTLGSARLVSAGGAVGVSRGERPKQ